MPTTLVKPTVMSVYEVNGQRVQMPERMARVTPDLKQALYSIRTELEAAGGKLFLSDLYRSYDMQLQAHLDFTSGKKKAFSPAPGGSMHESGRAFDIDIASMKVTLAAFWAIAARYGVVPIIAEPDPGKPECWHFECRGSHQRVYDHYKAGKGTNFDKPAVAMAVSAIISVGLPHDRVKGKEREAFVQSGLIRLGHDIGNIDGAIGPKTISTLETLGIRGDLPAQVAGIDALLQQQFPAEYFDRAAEPLHPFG